MPDSPAEEEWDREAAALAEEEIDPSHVAVPAALPDPQPVGLRVANELPVALTQPEPVELAARVRELIALAVGLWVGDPVVQAEPLSERCPLVVGVGKGLLVKERLELLQAVVVVVCETEALLLALLQSETRGVWEGVTEGQGEAEGAPLVLTVAVGHSEG